MLNMSAFREQLTRLWQLMLVELVLLIDLTSGSEYCWYTHEDYGTPKQVYCESGCCETHGEADDICCFKWSVGVILGVCFGILVVLITVTVVVLCCYSAKKKRNKTGAVGVPTTHHQTYAPYYAGSAGYAFPHPPSAYYPASQFPNNPPCNIPPSTPAPPYTSEEKTNQQSIFQSTTIT